MLPHHGHAHRCPSDKKGHKDWNHHSNPGEQLMDGDWREDQDGRKRRQSEPRSRKESLFLEEEMRKERMLITVSQDPDPPPHPHLGQDLQTLEKTVRSKSQKKKKKKKNKKDGKKKNKKEKS